MPLKPRQRARGGVNDLAADERREHAPLQTRFVKRRVLAQRREMSGINNPGLVRVEDDEIGARAPSEACRRQAKGSGGPARQGGQETRQGDLARMDETQGSGEHRLEADRAIRRFGKGLAFRLDILRIVIRDDGVDHPFRQAGDQSLTIPLGTQRRGNLEEGPVVADVAFVEGKMVDGDAAGDGKAFFLGGADRFERIPRKKSRQRDSVRPSIERGRDRA